MDELIALARDVGFDHAGELNMDALVFLPEVRSMCQSNRCRAYGTRWSCPPACGTLEESAARASRYKRGILVQTTGNMRHDFDAETMFAAEKRHKKNFDTLVRQIRREYPGCLPMGAGSCTRCEKCTYPDRPCRFPDQLFVSMEAYGLLVTDVCRKSGMKYDYGPRTITYSSCVLID